MSTLKTIKMLTVLAITAVGLASMAGSSAALNVATTDTLQASKPAATPPDLVLASGYGYRSYGYSRYGYGRRY